MDSYNVDILLIRMDKIGDLVVTLAVDEHPVFAGRRVHWFISKGLGFIADQAVPQRTASEFKRRFSPVEFMRMYRSLKKLAPQTVVLFHTPWWVSLCVWLADVPERIGRLSQWHSFLFLNIGIRQKRSLSDRHESDYNYDLVELGFRKLGSRKTSHLENLKKTFLRLTAPNPFATIAAKNLKSRQYRIVHPGMAGSSLNWPATHFAELIERLAHDAPVVITGTSNDFKYLQALEHLKNQTNVKWLVDQLKVNELLDLLSQARSVVAPSTGVLHLAASLGTPVVGIYSPRRMEHPKRWGPKGLYVCSIVPPVQEADNFSPDVMTQINSTQVLEKVIQLENRVMTNEDRVFTQL